MSRRNFDNIERLLEEDIADMIADPDARGR